MDLLAAWVLFPLAVGVVCLGCGLLVERVGGRTLPGVALMPAGFAFVLVAVRLLAELGTGAALGLPVLAAAAAAGFFLGWARLRGASYDPWAAGAAIAAALVCGLPVLLSGEPTFVGSLVLSDSGHQLALAAMLGDVGVDWQSLDPSSLQAGTGKYVRTAYPLAPQAGLGALAPLGVIDLAWLFQPFLCFMVAITALGANALVAPWVNSRRGRAVVSLAAAVPALLVSYAQQGSIKEIGGLAMVVLVAALVARSVTEEWRARAFVGPVAAAVAAAGALGPVVMAYAGPPLLVGAVALARRTRRAPRRGELAASAGVILAGLVLALPILLDASTALSINDKVLSGKTQGEHAAASAIGNLARALETKQATGVWLSGDYRYPPAYPRLNQILTYAMIGAALLGLVLALRRCAWGPLLLAGTLGGASLVLLPRGVPYADAKVLALLSVAAPLLASLAAVWVWSRGKRFRLPGGVIAGLVAAGLFGSAALAYHEAQLAPFERYEEMRSIGEQLEGKGPVIFTEYDEYAKHFMRDSRILSQPEWPYEVRIKRLSDVDVVVGIANRQLHPSFKAPLDLDGIPWRTVQAASFLVTRRSPTASRPPANFRLVRSGRYYEVWKRTPARVLAHEPLGLDVFDPGGRTSCEEVERTAERARAQGARLAYVERRRMPLYDPEAASEQNRGFGFPSRVSYPNFPRNVTVDGPGTAVAELGVPEAGRYRVFIQGSFGRETDVRIDGRKVGAVSYEGAHPGSYLDVGEVKLSAGPHRLEVERAGGDLRPGNGGGYLSNLLHMGPVVLSSAANQRREVRYVAPEKAGELCRKRLDWLEVVKG